MSEIQRLTLPGTPLNPMASHTTEPLGQRFGQLLAQLSPEDQAWATAAELLAQSQYTNEAGESQAYVSEGVLTEVGKAHIQAAQARLQQQTGATEVSIEQGAKQLLVEALTTQYALEDNPAILQRAQTLQTELSAELTPQPDTPPAEVQSQPSINDLETYLAGQLQSLGHSSREAFEASQVDLGSGEVPVSALLATESEPRGQLKLLISIAAQQLQVQQAQAAQLERAEPPATPVVEPVKVPKGPLVKLVPGELYEFEVGEGSRHETIKLISKSFAAYRYSIYYGSTYHLQFLDANGKVMPVQPVLQSEGGTLSSIFSAADEQLSVYWHGNTVNQGTSYTIGGSVLALEENFDLAMDLPLMMVETGEGLQYLRIDNIPFDKIRISNEGARLFNLPTQADVDAAKAALKNPQNLTLQQILQYTTPALRRANTSNDFLLDVAAAIEKNNLKRIIDNAFSTTTGSQEIIAKTQEISNDVLRNRRGFDGIADTDDFFLEYINMARLKRLEANKLNIAANELAPQIGKDPSELNLNIHRDIDLKGIDLAGIDLSGQVLYRLDLRNANLVGANLSDVVLIDVKLDDANLNGATLRGALLEGVSLRRANLQATDLTRTLFKGVDFRAANMSQANLANVNFASTLLSQADISEANLSGSTLTQLDLSGVNFQKANLRSALLNRSDMSKTSFKGANLEQASFMETSLLEVDLTGANLLNTTFFSSLIDDLKIDQSTLNSSFSLQGEVDSNFDIEENYSTGLIALMTSLTKLSVLEERLNTMYQDARPLDQYKIDMKALPRIKQRQRELLTSGVKAADHEFLALDFQHQDLDRAQLANADFHETDFSYTRAQGKDLHNIRVLGNSNLNGADWRHTNLNGATLRYISAFDIQLQGSNLQKTVLKNLNLQNGNLSGADISEADLSFLDLSSVSIKNLIYNHRTKWQTVTITAEQAQDLNLQLQNANGEVYGIEPETAAKLQLVIEGEGAVVTVLDEKTSSLPKAIENIPRLTEELSPRGMIMETGAYDFDGLDISGVNLSGSIFNNSSFQAATMRSVNLEKASLNRTNFKGADLQSVNLERARVLHADFQHADLRSASLVNTVALGAHFGFAQMQSSNLSGANLGGATLANANLQNANLFGADLRSADLSDVDLRQTNLQNIQHNLQTQWQGAQLTPEQIEHLGLNAEQLTASAETASSQSSGSIGIGDAPPASTDPNTPNSLQNRPQNGLGGFTISNTLKPFNNPNGIIGNDGSQAGHGDGNNKTGTITAVAGDPQEPNNPFQVINGQVVVGDKVLLPELDLSGGAAQPGETVFGIPVGLNDLPETTATTRTEPATNTPIADTTAKNAGPTSQQGGVTIGGQLGSKGEAEKANTEIEQLLGKGSRQGVRPDLFPTPIDNRIPGFGEGVPPADASSNDTRWGLPDEPITLPESEGFPEKDPVFDNILNPNGVGRPQFTFPPISEGSRIPEVPAEAQAALTKALPELQGIRYAQFSQLSTTDQQQVLPRTLAYQQLAPNDKTNISLIDYLDSRKTSEPQRQQLSRVDAAQTVQQAQLNTLEARTGLDNSTLDLINARINALQANTAQINQQTQSIQQSNGQRLNALATQAQTDPVGVAFIKPEAPQSTPENRPQIKAPTNLSQDSAPIPRFMVVRTENGPKLIENLANGQSQLHAYPLSADTPITRQESNGAWSGVPDVGQIGGRLFLDLLFTNGALKMLNNGNPVQAPNSGTPQQPPVNGTPQTPAGVPQPGF